MACSVEATRAGRERNGEWLVSMVAVDAIVGKFL
jgi:hypothetical protein